MTRGRMDHHPCRLIDDDQIFVLKDNIERNVFRYQISWGSWRHADCHTEAALQRLTCLFRRTTVHIHKAIRNQTLDAGARKLLQLPNQEFVEPLRSLVFKTEI